MRWRRKKVLAEHPTAKSEAEALLGLNQWQELKGIKHQLSLTTDPCTREENDEEPATSYSPMLQVKSGKRRCFQALS